jgi:LPXTG-motif cell wall-anchored protein
VRRTREPGSKVPDYNAVVTLRKVALAPTMGFASAEDDARTCRDLPGYTENLEGNTSGVWGSATFSQDSGPLVLDVNDGYTVWVCVKKGTAPVELGPYVGPLTGVDVSYPGTPPAEGFSHYSIRWEHEGEPGTYTVIPEKAWVDDYGVGFSAVITITPDDGVTDAKSWTFDHEGTRSNDIPIEIPMGVGYAVTEDVTAPSGWVCSLIDTSVGELGDDEVVTLTNECDERPPVTLPPVTLPPVTLPPATVTVPETVPATVPDEVAGEVVEATTTEPVVVAEALPRTGDESAVLALAALAALTLGGGLVAVARRRERVS